MPKGDVTLVHITTYVEYRGTSWIFKNICGTSSHLMAHHDSQVADHDYYWTIHASVTHQYFRLHHFTLDGTPCTKVNLENKWRNLFLSWHIQLWTGATYSQVANLPFQWCIFLHNGTSTFTMAHWPSIVAHQALRLSMMHEDGKFYLYVAHSPKWCILASWLVKDALFPF